MLVAFDLVVRAPADDVAGARQELDQDRNWIGLGVRSDRLHDIAS